MSSTVVVRQKGFTLVELMLSMALTAVLLGMLSAGVYAVVSDWQRETSVLDETLDKSLVMLQIERALFAAFPHSFIDRDALARFIYFEGTEDSVSWVSTVSPNRRSGLTAWWLRSNASDGVLLSLAPAYSDNPEIRLEDATPVPALENYTVRFSYLMQRGDEEKTWLTQWSGREMQSLPVAVYVQFIPNDRNDEQNLEIFAAIKNFRHEEIEPTIPQF